MNRLALFTGILSLTLAGVAAQAGTQDSSQTQPGSQPKLYQSRTQASSGTLPGITYSVTQPPETQPGSQPKLYQHQAMPGETTPPGSTYEATQQRSMTQPGSQPKLYRYEDRPASGLSTEPAPASGMGAIGTATGLAAPPPSARTQTPPAYDHVQGMGAVNVTAQVQSELRAAGYDPGPVDGIMGPRTRKAIRAYQAANGLPQDGTISPSLLGRLHQSSSAATERPRLQGQGQPSADIGASGATMTSTEARSAEQAAGFFSGWFQPMDSEAPHSLRRVQSGYHPNFHRVPTSSEESQGPGITYPYPEGPEASAATAAHPANEQSSQAIQPQNEYDRNNTGG